MSYELTNSDNGFIISGTCISALFFADDIVLIARSAKGLNDLLNIVKSNCLSLKLTISIKKSKIISSKDDAGIVADQYGDEVLSLERVIMYKYLGIEMYSTMYRTGVNKQKKAILTARRYKGACMNISRRGPDTTILATKLWSAVALPSILFGCDCIPFSDTNINKINQIQSQMCKSILSLPTPVNNFAAQTELAMQPFKQKLWTLQLNSCLRWMELPQSRWAKLAMMEHMSLKWKSPYWDYIYQIKSVVGV